MKNKKRHTKTLSEKFGYGNLLDNCNEFLNKNKRTNDEVLFNALPYLGIVYVPYTYDFRKLFIYTETGDIKKDNIEYIKLKILEINDINFTGIYYDNHHHQLSYVYKKRYDMYLLKGNELIINNKMKNV